jgi:glycosyltransferase involved in cell wall biosynthesis
MRISLVTLGDPDRMTGGYLYHRRLADAAPRHGARIEFTSFPDRRFPVPALFGRRVLAAVHDADVVVVDSIAMAFAAPWLRALGRPLAGVLHQGPGGIDHGALRTCIQGALDRRAYRFMSTLMVASESLVDELRPFHDDVRVVPPGRDVAAGVADVRDDLRAGRAAALLCVGNWVPRKGILELLEAYSLLPSDAATLHLVGDEDADPCYSREVRKRMAPLEGRVVAHGVVAKERVAALYRAADAFVLPSVKEPYGTVYGEAMAAGLPVLGWRAGNLPYLARHEREGLIVETGDVSALAAAMLEVAEDAGLRERLGAAAQARAQDFPTWEETAAMFFTIVREVADA